LLLFFFFFFFFFFFGGCFFGGEFFFFFFFFLFFSTMLPRRWLAAGVALAMVPPIVLIAVGFCIAEVPGADTRAVIVLGNAVLADGTASARLAGRARAGLAAAAHAAAAHAARVSAASGSPGNYPSADAIHNSAHVVWLLFTGGVGTHPPSEAEAALASVTAARVAAVEGVTALLEPQSTSTLENVVFARAVVEAAETALRRAEPIEAAVARVNAANAEVVRRRPSHVVAALDFDTLEPSAATTTTRPATHSSPAPRRRVLVVTDAFHAWRARELCRLVFPGECGVVVVSEARIWHLTWLWRELAWATRECAAVAWHTLRRARGLRPDTGLRVNFPF
jgi:uncharacterized SAM-binding protein YcdF (DUF218 family)